MDFHTLNFVALYVLQESSDPPHEQAYKEYIKYELKAGDPARIQSLFERALIENYANQDFWLKYGKFLVRCRKFWHSLCYCKIFFFDF
jgi:hypothetical protein